MVSDLGNEVTEPAVCECYKKLHLVGVPYYAVEDEEELEEEEIEPPEQAFRLPGILKIDDNFTNYPNVDQIPLTYVFEEMAQIIPSLADFEQNLLSFWILDIFIEALGTVQGSGFPFNHQRATLLWIAYFFNYIQNNNPSRQEMFRHLKFIFFKPETRDSSSEEKFWNEGDTEEFNFQDVTSFSSDQKFWKFPLPPGQKDLKVELEKKSSMDANNLTLMNSKETIESMNPSQIEITSELNVKHMNIILEILYRIFGNFWVFAEIQAVFHGMPYMEKVRLPFQLHFPKPRLKIDSSIDLQGIKSGPKVSAKISEMSSIESELDRAMHRNDYILPLMASEEAKLYIKKQSVQSQQSAAVKGAKKAKDGKRN